MLFSNRKLRSLNGQLKVWPLHDPENKINKTNVESFLKDLGNKLAELSTYSLRTFDSAPERYMITHLIMHKPDVKCSKLCQNRKLPPSGFSTGNPKPHIIFAWIRVKKNNNNNNKQLMEVLTKCLIIYKSLPIGNRQKSEQMFAV